MRVGAERGRGGRAGSAVAGADDAAARVLAVALRQGARREAGRYHPLGPKAERTRTALLDAATEVFVAQGYRATSVADIARAAGVSLGTYYQYFRDRADVMAALVGVTALELLEGHRKPWDPSRGRAGLRRALLAFVAPYAATAPFQALWEEVSHLEPEMASLRRDLTAVFTGTLEQALTRAASAGLVRDDLDPAGMARALTGMVDRYCYVTYVVGGQDGPVPSVEASADLLTELWADAVGLRARKP